MVLGQCLPETFRQTSLWNSTILSLIELIVRSRKEETKDLGTQGSRLRFPELGCGSFTT